MSETPDRLAQSRKEVSGSMATFIWIASGLYLFSTTTDAHFISVSALLYFVVGTFGAALFLGAGAFYASRGLEWINFKVGLINPAIGAVLGLCAILLFIAEFVVGFLAARLVFRLLVFG